MKRDYKLFINDIRNSIARIEGYIKNVSEHQFLNDTKLQDAVVRRLEIIGEATKSYRGNKWGRKTIISDRLIKQAQELKQQGLSLSKIAGQLKISKSSVFKLLPKSIRGT